MNGNDAQAKAAKFGEQNVSTLTFGKCLVDLFIYLRWKFNSS